MNSMMSKMKNKKGQEEIVGFVLIVVIVAIIALVFLGITIRKPTPATQKDSGDVSQFLESTMDYTSECAIVSDSVYVNIESLIRECNSKSICLSGENSCDVLERDLRSIIGDNWKVGADRPVKGYMFNATYNSDNINQEVKFISEGNCTSSIIGATHLSPAYPGNLRDSLQICY